MAELSVLAAAESEFNEALDWYANKSLIAADRFTVEVDRAIEAIRSHPDRYPQWDETYRFYLLDRFPYIVCYRCTADKIVVVAINHTSRDQDAWQRR